MVFCSANSNAKQALPDQDSRKPEVSILAREKGRCSKVTSKSEQKIKMVYSHIHFFSPSYLLSRTVFRTECFGFSLLKQSCHVVERHRVGKRDPAPNESAGLNWRVLRPKSSGVDLCVPFEKMCKACRVQRLLPTQHILAQVLIPLFCTSRTPSGQDHGIISNSSSVHKSKLTWLQSYKEVFLRQYVQ